MPKNAFVSREIRDWVKTWVEANVMNALSILFLFAPSQPSYREGMRLFPKLSAAKVIIAWAAHESCAPCLSALMSGFWACLSDRKTSNLTIFMASGLETAARELTPHPP